MDGLDSEFICAVGRVLVCEPHPGADRLDLVTITISGDGGAFPYRLIVGRGDFKPGDRCVYVGPDSVVPLAEGSPFAFLSSRLDAKGKTEYRIRSARIRGLFSPGLVIPCSDVVVSDCSLSIGDDVSEHLRVRPYRSAAEEAPHAGSNAGGSKGLLPLSDPFPVYTVTALKKCPRLFEEGEPVVITEKIHGTNFRFGYGGESKFYYGTHRTALADTRSAWRRFKDWLSGKHSFELVKKLTEQDSVYGGIREGVVIESTTGERRKAKWVSERYHMRKDG